MKSLKIRALLCVLTLVLSSGCQVASASYGKYQEPQLGQYSDAELAQMLAPIALYPDSLLTHIVIASTYPLEVVEAYRWQQDHRHLSPAEAVELAQQEAWDPSVTALVAFPDVLERLNDDLQWTQDLGNAVLEDEARVLDAVQDLRQQAYRANSLQDLQNLQVVKRDRKIIIEPVRQEIIYVPYYDTRMVYGNWRYNRYPPIHWSVPAHLTLQVGHNGYSHRHSARFFWSAGVNIRFNYFFSAFSWRHKHIVVTHHHNSRVYRPYHRYSVSHGAIRWQHQGHHRRGVKYRSSHVSEKYASVHTRNRDTQYRQSSPVLKHEKQNTQNRHLRLNNHLKQRSVKNKHSHQPVNRKYKQTVEQSRRYNEQRKQHEHDRKERKISRSDKFDRAKKAPEDRKVKHLQKQNNKAKRPKSASTLNIKKERTKNRDSRKKDPI